MADYRIWPATDGPGAASVDASVNLATEFYVTDTASVRAIHFWRADTSITGPVLGRIWRADGGITGSAVADTDVTFTLAGTGWQTATLPAPVALTPGQRYRAACLFPTNYSATGGYWSSGAGASGLTNGLLVAPSTTDATHQDQGSFTYDTVLTYPFSSFGGGGYWVDVTVTDGGQVVLLGRAAETDTAMALTPAKAKTVGQPQTTEAALPARPVKTARLGRAIETDTPLTLIGAISPRDVRLTTGAPVGRWQAASPRSRWQTREPR